MRPLTPADVADAGLVRLGAGIRAPRPFALPLPLRPAGQGLRRPGQPPAAAPVPAMVADSGLVRLGAGIRRA
ncbi:hypothetical protein QWZ14_20205 [Paeniroseomonas aquatica]|uniref:Uncharacterized protein n=1 Tax=Paeniroseomonas aquatica TaxID=373043 RepID=A0ABT8AAE5_9PROT|nr:hypothetical protein [Paeniroseomonas aquatica]MDN3566704.1 hypothetical protein [Paeniroseomonas aquatica]